jgi:hypothetical protein
MSHLPVHCILFAQQNPLNNFAREFQGRETRLNSGYLAAGLLVVLGMCLAVWLLGQLLERYGGRRPVDNARTLFLALCRAHRLRWSEAWLLWRVARDQQLTDPARLFLEPNRLDPAKVDPVLRRRSAELEAISQRLFAGAKRDGEEDPEPIRGDPPSPSTPPEADDPLASNDLSPVMPQL